MYRVKSPKVSIIDRNRYYRIKSRYNYLKISLIFSTDSLTAR